MNMVTARLALILLTLFVTILLFNACSFSAKASRKLLERAREKPYDIVVVPGVPFEKGIWSRTMKGRVYWSKYLYDNGIAKNIMFSGSSVYSPYYESEIMALYAVAIGIPKEHIFTETLAEHSTENIFYSCKKAKKLGFTRIALASDPFQTKSLRRYTRKKISGDIGLIPMVADTMRAMRSTMTDPEIEYDKAFNKNFISILKRENAWKRLRGTMGKNIDHKAYE